MREISCAENARIWYARCGSSCTIFGSGLWIVWIKRLVLSILSRLVHHACSSSSTKQVPYSAFCEHAL